ncbi:hypothetical protein EDD15DRAFT_2371109 [Pisolithus albus]|nr:hypothetical protein EDD15DRAFT_2371109 [Pisolithus albus]
MRSEGSIYFSAEEGDSSMNESRGPTDRRLARFPRPLKFSVLQDPEEDTDGDVTLRGYSPSQIKSGTKDQILDNVPLSSIETSNEGAYGRNGKDAVESLLSPHHVSDEDSDVGDKTITSIRTPILANKEQCKGSGLRAANFPRPLRLSLATQPSREASRPNAPLSLREAADFTNRIDRIDHTPVTRRDLHLFKETMEVGLTNVVRETMTRVMGEIVQTQPAVGCNADEESEASPQRKCRPKGLPRHRRPDTNLFHKNIRDHALRLMHRTQWDSPFTDVPTKAEVEAYTPALGPPCTSDRFRVDLSGVPGTDWNKSASQVFLQSFRDAYPDCTKSSKDICVAWERHFNRLRQIYRDQQERARLAQAELARTAAGHSATPGSMKSSAETRQQTRRRQERKSNLYIRRLHVAKVYSQQHPTAARTVEELGMPGMSSDDSDHESGEGAARYAIVSKDWRSSEVTELLRLLDALHLRLRYRNNWNATSGAWPHLRLVSRKSSTRAAVKGLPKNFYNRKFLVSLTQEAFGELQLVEQVLPVGIPDGLRELAKPYDVFNRRIVGGQANVSGSAGDETTAP